jgi:hypothetical protein
MVAVKGKCLLVLVAMTALISASAIPFSSARAEASLVGQEGGTTLQVFRGTVYSKGGTFVLRDESRKTWYRLDDQRSAKPLEGKQVRVIGILDASTATIHVESIEEDPVHSGLEQGPRFSQETGRSIYKAGVVSVR